MAQSIISAGDVSNGLATQAGNDGTLVIQSGPAGGKLNAISIAANGVVSMPYNPVTAGLTLGTAQTASNNTFFDFTGIPSTAKRITVMLMDVSTNSTSNFLIQIGSGSIQNTGYNSAGGGAVNQTVPYVVGSSAGFILVHDVAADARTFVMKIYTVGANKYVSEYSAGGTTNRTIFGCGGGSVSLTGTLDRLRITTVNGTDQFDAGSVNIMWE